jgi:nucleoside-diphosphate kinase
MEAQRERTFVMIKPDGVQRFLVGEIISRFERRGYKLVGMKFLQPSEYLLRQHYTDLASLPFFPKLLAYVSSGPVVAMIWEGTAAVSNGRKMVGATRPGESLPGTIRGDYALDVGRNVIHASDSVESARREIGLWFTEAEQATWTSAQQAWIYE